MGLDSDALILTPWRESRIQAVNWSAWHHKLNRHLLNQSHLLPKGKTIVLAISGGQDSMALLGLLKDLATIHEWTLSVWHGNHGWHEASQRCSDALEIWCQEQGLSFESHTADPTKVQSEATARSWRYACLEQSAATLEADIVTGHTATDRTETLLLQMARGSDLKGLCSLRAQRPLKSEEPQGIQLSRPMLIFQRHQTAQICQALQLPTWPDPTNKSSLFARNRVRHEVLPVLEELYPGCERRISNLSERLSATQEIQQELVDQCLKMSVRNKVFTRETIKNSSPQLRRILINRWMHQQGAPQLNAPQLDELSRRLGPCQPPGKAALPKGWTFSWTGQTMQLDAPHQKQLDQETQQK